MKTYTRWIKCLLVSILLLLGGGQPPVTTLASRSQAQNIPVTAQPTPLNVMESQLASSAPLHLVNQLGGSTKAVAIQGDYAYIGIGPRLVVLEMSDPLSPTVRGQSGVMSGIVTDIVVTQTHAYVVDSEGWLRVIDVSSPYAPVEVCSFEGTFKAVTVSGDTLIAGGYDLSLFDLTDPAQPSEVTTSDVLHGALQDMVAVGEYMYVVSGYSDSALQIIDISSPQSPQIIGSYTALQYARGVAVSGTYAYVIAKYGASLWIIDVSTPAQPDSVGSYGTGYDAGAFAVTVAGDYAYIAGGDFIDAELLVVDVSTPSAPVEVGDYKAPGFAVEDVAVIGNYAYVAHGPLGLHVVDIVTPSDPTKVAVGGTVGYIWDLDAQDFNAYLTDALSGQMRIIDLMYPSVLIQVGAFEGYYDARNVVVVDRYAYMIDAAGALNVIDVLTPSVPSRVGQTHVAYWPDEMTATEDYVYTDGGGGFHVIDVYTPTTPTKVGFMPTSVSISGLAVANSHVYVASWGGLDGLRIIDVSNPFSPTEVFSSTTANVVDVTTEGSYLYTISRDTFATWDISTPANPVQLGTYGYNMSYSDLVKVAVGGAYAYVTTEEDGLRIIDVSSPTNPVEVGHFKTPGRGEKVVAAEGQVLLTDAMGGLYILTQPNPALHYAGSRLSLMDMMQDEADGHVTTGDHVHLSLPFTNTSGVTVTNAIVFLRGAPAAGSRPGVHLASATQPWTQQLIYDLGRVLPDETAYADVWLYVERLEPNISRTALHTWTYFQIVDGKGTHHIPISVQEIRFPAVGYQDMTGADCLHNPDDFVIAAYAQYAAGYADAPIPLTLNPNQYDPDQAHVAVMNMVTNVNDEFGYISSSAARVPDTLLLTARHQDIGACRHYADLTIGLLRALNLPTRMVSAKLWNPHLQGVDDFGLTSGHAWAEVYLPNQGGWRQADSTWGEALNESIYESVGKPVQKAWAERYPLCSMSSHLSDLYRCISSCYQSTNCTQCKRDSGILHPSLDLSCVIDVTSSHYPTASSRKTAQQISERILIDAQANVFVTQNVPFTLTASMLNSTTTAFETLTATVVITQDIDSTKPLYEVDSQFRLLSNVSPGETVTATWVITPLMTGTAIPLSIEAFSDGYSGSGGIYQQVNEPGTLPDLTIGATRSARSLAPGQGITLTAFVLDEMLQSHTGAMITATLYTEPATAFSTAFILPYCAGCGAYQHTMILPADAPPGRYWIDYRASHPDYDSATTRNGLWVVPPIDMALSINDHTLSTRSSLTLTATVSDRGRVVTDASVRAVIATPSGTITLPLLYETDHYVNGFPLSALAPELGERVPEGQWYITAKAEYYGGTAATSETLQVADCTPLTDVGIDGPLDITGSLFIDKLYTFQAIITPTEATTPITYTWTPDPVTGQGEEQATYQWDTPDTHTITLRAENCGGVFTATQPFQLWERDDHFIYLPLVLRQ